MRQHPDSPPGACPAAMRRRLLPCALFVVSALVSAGCRNDGNVVTDVDPTGVYALVSIDGKAVPCSVAHEGASLCVDSGAFDIQPGGTCTSTMHVVAPGGRKVAVRREATYTRQGATLTMTWKGFGTTTGTVDGNTFSMDNEGSVYTYRK